jgi:hypothetical protein
MLLDTMALLQLQKDEPLSVRPMFSLDLRGIPPLVFTAIKCRECKTRHEALRLLERFPKTKEVWDYDVTLAYCQWLVGLEEERMVDGIIPEVARVKAPSVHHDSERGVAIMKCWQTDQETGDLQMREMQCAAPKTPGALWLHQLRGPLWNPASSSPAQHFHFQGNERVLERGISRTTRHSFK